MTGKKTQRKQKTNPSVSLIMKNGKKKIQGTMSWSASPQWLDR